MAIQNFDNADAGSLIRPRLNGALDVALTPFVQSRGWQLPSGAFVVQSDKIYRANAAIPDGTAFAEGTTGATFTEVSAGGASAWADYTLSVTSTGTNPTIGTPTVNRARFKADGTTLFLNVALVIGTGALGGSGTYRFSIPSGYTIDLPDDAELDPGPAVGAAYVRSLAQIAGGAAVYDSATNAIALVVHNTAIGGIVGDLMFTFDDATGAYSFTAALPYT